MLACITATAQKSTSVIKTSTIMDTTLKFVYKVESNNKHIDYENGLMCRDL